ncbi:MAG: M28 family peptidase [Gemmatimonadaceae bacterium]|nr:M28 family peptidase [Gemmatimonadaceae bacterium]
MHTGSRWKRGIRALVQCGVVGALLVPVQVHAQAGATNDATTARLMQRLSILAADSMEGRRAGTPGAAKARRWLISELKTIGAEPVGASFEHPFTIRARNGSTDTNGVNVVARIRGTNRSGPALVMSAHYDHLGVRNGEVFNGADDDASGCVTLLMIAERLMRERPTHDVILAFFDAEESGLQGARAFVAAPPVPLETIGMNINLDMVARQDAGALWVAGTSHTPALKAVAENAAKGSAVTIRFGHDTKDLKPGDDWTNSSDHGAFHAKGIPFLYLGVEDHPDYHKSGDDADKVNPTFFRGTMEYAYALMRRADAALNDIAKQKRATP